MYFLLKILHVISGSVVFGTGLGLAIYLWLTNKHFNQQANINLLNRCYKLAVKLNWSVIVPAACFQVVTGFAIFGVKGYGFNLFWVRYTFLGFVVAAMCWVVMMYFLLRCQYQVSLSVTSQTALSTEYSAQFKRLYLFGLLAISSIIFMIFLMANRVA